MGHNEARLRAMLDPNATATWDLNDEDKAAIQWALALIGQQRTEIEDARAERIGELRRLRAVYDEIRGASRGLASAIDRI